MSKHRKPGLITDRVQDRYRNLSGRVIRARHRMYGPPQAPTLHDMTPEEFTSVKGAGGRT